jgi:hypothetical protein
MEKLLSNLFWFNNYINIEVFYFFKEFSMCVFYVMNLTLIMYMFDEYLFQ